VTPEMVSVTLSVADLELLGVAWSATSGNAVSLQWLGGWFRDVLSWRSLRPVSDMLTVFVGFGSLLFVVRWLVDGVSVFGLVC